MAFHMLSIEKDEVPTNEQQSNMKQKWQVMRNCSAKFEHGSAHNLHMSINKPKVKDFHSSFLQENQLFSCYSFGILKHVSNSQRENEVAPN